MVDGREKTELYDLYGKLFAENNFHVLDTRLPDSKRFRREPSDDRKSVFRSTILPPDTAMLRGKPYPGVVGRKYVPSSTDKRHGKPKVEHGGHRREPFACLHRKIPTNG